MSPTDHPTDGAGGAITLRTMGSFFFGGRVLTNEIGDTWHGDHGYAQYFVPTNSRQYPMILWHGIGQSGKTWESTPDGRDGFWQIFTKRDWPLYIIDQPRRGRAGRVAIAPDEPVELDPHPPLESEATAWSTFRFGEWKPPAAPQFFPGLQFPTDSESVRQFMCQQTPNTGPEPFPNQWWRNVMGGAVAQLVDQVGEAVLICHSHSAQYGWVTAMERPSLVKAVIAIEPGEYAFPEDDPPPALDTQDELLDSFMAPQLVPAEKFKELTLRPIMVMLADNISDVADAEYGAELWRLVRQRAIQFVDAVNSRGGDAEYVELPHVGLKGNSHFPMADLNNLEVADLIEDFLARRDLNGRAVPHAGPARSLRPM